MRENIPSLVKEKYIQVQEEQRFPHKTDPKTTTPRHIIIKMQTVKGKERILKAAREMQRVTYKGVPLRLSAHFSKETYKEQSSGSGATALAGWLLFFWGTLLFPRTGINTGTGMLLVAGLLLSPHWTQLRIF